MFCSHVLVFNLCELLSKLLRHFLSDVVFHFYQFHLQFIDFGHSLLFALGKLITQKLQFNKDTHSMRDMVKQNCCSCSIFFCTLQLAQSAVLAPTGGTFSSISQLRLAASVSSFSVLCGFLASVFPCTAAAVRVGGW